MGKWVIVKLAPGSLQMLNKTASGFTENLDEVVIFDSEELANAMASQLKTSTMVHQLSDDQVVASKFQFPTPDFFEVFPEPMDLPTMIKILRADDPLEYFTPVDKITGAWQMTGGGLSDSISGRLNGRFYQFSFDQLLCDSDVEELHKAIATAGKWSTADYRIIRLGFTAYAVLTLRVRVD